MRLSRTTTLCLAALLLLGALKFLPFVLGGIFVFRDAGYFFLPLREISSNLLRHGEFPLWNDFASNGRALAANPNAGAFWPLSFLLVVLDPSRLVLLHVALLLTSAFGALCWVGLSRRAALWGSAVLLFSGVFQTLPILFTTLASTIPLPLALAAVAVPADSSRRAVWRRFLIAGLLLGLSFLGGEPVITATGAVAVTLVVLVTLLRDRAEVRHRLAAWFVLALVAGGLSAVQLVPVVGELKRSARQESMRPEDGALYWSVRPQRILTLLEPRLTGDPFAESEKEYWGAATFDARNPYFYDIALGLLPLLCLGAAWRTAVGRGALILAAATAVLSFGRFVPLYANIAEHLKVIRYPEKWWVVTTLFLCAAAAAGFEALTQSLPEAVRAMRRLAFSLGGVFLFLLLLLLAAPASLGRLLMVLGLATEPVAPAEVRTVLFLPVALSAASLLLCVIVERLIVWDALRPEIAAALLGMVFLADAVRRTHESCPAGPPDLFSKVPPHVAAVLDQMPRGRFYDEAANVVAVAVRRVREAGGFDPLRPTTGVIYGVRYAGENDIDRMTPAASVAFSRHLARTSWSEAKLRLLERANVSVARVPLSEPLLPGTREILRVGGDRIISLLGTRPEMALARSASPIGPPSAAPDFAQLAAAPADVLLEQPLKGPASAAFDLGGVRVLKRTASHQSLEVTTGPSGGILRIARTYDPNWAVTINGKPASLQRADLFLSALPLSSGRSMIELSYRNRSITAGALVTLLTALAAGGALFVTRSR